MVKMPPNYIEYCKPYAHLTAWTMFKYHKRPEPYDDNNYYYCYSGRHMVGSGDPMARIQLLYALRSFPKQHDNAKYTLYVLATDGIYVEENGFHSITDEPIKFRNTYLYKISDFSALGNLVINKDDTRMVQFIFNYKYQEFINDVAIPNSFDFNYHRTEYPDKDIRSHTLAITGDDITKPIILPYDKYLYNAIKKNQTYIYLRADNYIDFELLDTWNPSF